MKLEELKTIEQQLSSLTNRNLLYFRNFRRFLNLRKNLKQIVEDEFKGSILYKEFWNIENQKHRRGFTFLLDLNGMTFNSRGEIISTVSDYLSIEFTTKKEIEKFIINILQELIEDYIAWVKKAQKKFLKKEYKNLSDLQIAESFLNLDNRIITRRVAGLIISLVISSVLIRLLKKEKIKLPKDDDILPLCDKLRSKTKNQSLKRFLNKNYPYFQQASKVRIGSVHIKERPPNKSEIEIILSLTKNLINKFHPF